MLWAGSVWHRMEKKIISSQNGESENYDETSEAKIIDNQDERAHCIRTTETVGKRCVQSKIELFEERP